MTDDIKILDTDTAPEEPAVKVERDEEYQEAVRRQAEENLKPIKSKLDDVYKKLEAATRELARKEEAEKEAKRKKLEDEGKHTELAAMKIAELEERNKFFEERWKQATRDTSLSNAMSGLDFRNDYARKTAFNDIVNNLVQDDDGIWVHSSGLSVEDYVKKFATDPEKDFLFKPAANGGAGLTPKDKNGNPQGAVPKDLSTLTSEQLLAYARAGKFGGPRSF